MTLEEKVYDAAVIGGGLAGLTAAVYLAKAGKSVVVFEKGARLGGFAQTTYKNGAMFNLGPHAMYEGGAALQILNELGCLPKGGYSAKSGAPMGIWQGTMVNMATDLSFQENTEWSELMGGLSQIDTESIRSVSFEEWAAKHIRYERVRMFFTALCRQLSYCDNPSVLSAGYVIRQGQLARQGVKYVEGDWQTVVDDLKLLAEQAGAVVVKGCSVKQIVLDEGAVRAVMLPDGSEVEARSVIAAAGPGEACRMVPGAERMSLGRWKTACRPLYAACLDLALARVPHPERVFALGLDQPLYYSNHSSAVRLSDNGAYVLHMMKYNDNRSDSDPKADKRMLTSLLDLLQPGWDKEVVAERYLPKILVAHDSRTIRHHGGGPAPGPAVPEIRGLFVSGDWVGPEGRLADTAMATAKLAAQEILLTAG